ncbi:glycosyl hydrolase family 18 protein [Pseudobacter ginsenosidimutans]|uniref:Glycosyl hydrolase family 18 (Putative chitinase) n=1 Tax=Pseudobacter ginsenosidimutans TaxID=661488 RepID=A0A4V2F1Z5_9BACT|nr:glycosyl hydrolase family 18 protein [Pseudobacter ginsenosidimutans]QEC44056.1 hypothetical protein FSB84_21115 [Pseudobacter ginsenosidimutans]RZS75496.1 glycosyl hydrolase family 18 (putative chitinase) [Pseudobacter ginsenosidimutans]
MRKTGAIDRSFSPHTYDLAPWCYNKQKKQFATFDNRRSVILKTQYAINERLQGLMFWELRQDRPREGLLDAIYEVKMQVAVKPND